MRERVRASMSFPDTKDVGILDPSDLPLSWKNATALLAVPKTESGKRNIYSKTLASSFITDGVWCKAVVHVAVWVLTIVFDFNAHGAMKEASKKVPQVVTEDEASLMLSAAAINCVSVFFILLFGSCFASLPQWPVLNAVLFFLVAIPIALILAALPSATRQGGMSFGLTVLALMLHVMGFSLILAFYLAMVTRFDSDGSDLQDQTQSFLQNLLPPKDDMWTRKGLRALRNNWNKIPRMKAEQAPEPEEKQEKQEKQDVLSV